MARKKTWLGVFDRPLYRDWLFWHGLLWTAAVAVSSFTDPPDDAVSPLFLNAILAGLLTFFLLGWPIAGLRWIIRRFRARGRPIGTRPPAPPVSGPATGPWTPPPHPPPPDLPPLSAPPPAAASPAPSPPRRETTWATTPAPPAPLSGYRGAGLADVEAISTARRVLPYPIARACRATQGTHDPLEQYQNLLDLAEHLTITLGILSASWIRAHAADKRMLERLAEAYRGPGVSQGAWHDVINAAATQMMSPQTAFPGFTSGLAKRHGTRLLNELKVALEERNRAAHGGRPHNRAEAAVRVMDLAPSVSEAVGRAAFLRSVPWVLVEGVALRRQDNRWNVRMRNAMGDHPEFDASTEILDQPLVNDSFYVLTEPVPLDLTPMLVMRYCDQCRQPEVCYADRIVGKAGVSLKSFARGHQMFDADLVGEFASLGPGSSPGFEHGA